jgi:hypothetical protein
VGVALLVIRALTVGGSPVPSYNYTTFLSQVQQMGHVKSATFDPTGAITGTLTNGHGYSSQIPTALQDTQLPSILKAHYVVIADVGASTAPRARTTHEVVDPSAGDDYGTV